MAKNFRLNSDGKTTSRVLKGRGFAGGGYDYYYWSRCFVKH